MLRFSRAVHDHLNPRNVADSRHADDIFHREAHALRLVVKIMQRTGQVCLPRAVWGQRRDLVKHQRIVHVPLFRMIDRRRPVSVVLR